eukprot:COSAG06_NODE_2459_length_6837_cov_11.462897_1_plen_77_part_00
MDRQDHCVGFNPVRKRVLLRHYIYIYSASFCQDRLGANIGKALKKGPFFCRVAMTTSVGVMPTAAGLRTWRRAGRC